MSTTKDTEQAKDQAKAQLAGIVDLMAALKTAEDKGKVTYEGETLTEEEMQERILNDPLDVSIRESWHAPGKTGEVIEWKIVLCSGGPAVRLIGELDRLNQPESVRLEYQDWFTAWEDYPLTSEEEAACLVYAHQFWFGE